MVSSILHDLVFNKRKYLWKSNKVQIGDDSRITSSSVSSPSSHLLHENLSLWFQGIFCFQWTFHLQAKKNQTYGKPFKNLKQTDDDLNDYKCCISFATELKWSIIGSLKTGVGVIILLILYLVIVIIAQLCHCANTSPDLTQTGKIMMTHQNTQNFAHIGPDTWQSCVCIDREHIYWILANDVWVQADQAATACQISHWVPGCVRWQCGHSPQHRQYCQRCQHQDTILSLMFQDIRKQKLMLKDFVF